MELVTLDFDDFDPENLNGVVRKHNDLIEARYQLPSLQEQRVIHMLLGQIKPDDEDFKGYRIAVSDFAKIAGIRADTLYSQMDSITLSLRNRSVSIRNGKSFFHTGWLSSAEYKHGTGYVELCFDPKLKPWLLQLKEHFTQYKLEAVLHFKSIYAIRLYEMLKKEAFKAKLDPTSKTKRFQVEYTYEEMRESFGINKKEYKLFAHFRTKTIEPAVTEIYDKTDLNIYDVVYGKTGRAISRILFKVEVREKAEAEVRALQIRLDEKPKEASGKEELKTRLQELGYSAEYASRDVNKYGKQRIERSIAYTLAMQKAGEVKNFPAYLSKVIEGDLGGAWETAIVEKKEKAEKQKQAEQEKLQQQAKEAKAIKEKHKKVLETFYILPEVLKQPLREEFRKSIEDNTFVYPKWVEFEKSEKDPFQENKMIQSMFTDFLIKKGF